MAFVYKIKPLQWTMQPNGDMTTHTVDDTDVIVYKNVNGTYTAHESGIAYRFSTSEEAMIHIEEEHIRCVKKYLEEV